MARSRAITADATDNLSQPDRLPDRLLPSQSSRKTSIQRHTGKSATSRTAKSSGHTEDHIKSPRRKGNASSKAQRQPSAETEPTKSGNASRTLYSFFNVATQRQTKSSGEAVSEGAAAIRSDDFISDDPLDDSSAYPQRRTDPPKESLPVRKKRLFDSHSGNQDATAKGYKFLKANSGAKSKVSATEESGPDIVRRPWSEEYAPTSLNELAVHKKKIADVQLWLDDVFCGRSTKRLLVLKGPSGAGKTAVIRILSNVLNYHIQEWGNPDIVGYGSNGTASAISQFDDFLERSDNYGALPTNSKTSNNDSQPGRKLILVEDFPSSIYNTASTLQSFRLAIRRYLAVQSHMRHLAYSSLREENSSTTPLVLILSEVLLSTAKDSNPVTAHRILGLDILDHPCTSVIAFNPIAPTLLTKALKQVLIRDSQRHIRNSRPSAGMLSQLAVAGDVRSAISALEFICLHGHEDTSQKVMDLSAKAKRGDTTKRPTSSELETLELVTQRDNALDLFHSVGKVVYNKRGGSSAAVAHPPAFAPELIRTEAPEVDANHLINELSTDIETFVAALHENYLMSCQETGVEETLDSVSGCSERLSDAVLISGGHEVGRGYGRSRMGSGRDDLILGEASFQIAVRGLLFYLPSPVKRIARPKLPGASDKSYRTDAFKMYYPMSISIWRKTEESRGILDYLLTKIRTADFYRPLTDRSLQRQLSSNIRTWKSVNFGQNGSTDHLLGARKNGPSEKEQELDGAVLIEGGSKILETLLERLPYMAFILKTNQKPSSSLYDMVERLVRFRGIGSNSDETDDNELESDSDSMTHTTAKLLAKRTKSEADIGIKLNTSTDNEREKVVLSDDDIED